VCQMCQEEGFKFCLDTRKNRASPWIQPTLRAYMFDHQPVYPSNTKEWVIMGLFLACAVNLLGEHVKQVQWAQCCIWQQGAQYIYIYFFKLIWIYDQTSFNNAWNWRHFNVGDLIMLIENRLFLAIIFFGSRLLIGQNVY
jgi:hypothetical protein